jgi:hypothetical protein
VIPPLAGIETNFSYNGGVTYIVREYQPADFEALWKLDQACFAPGIAYSRRELMTYIARRSAFTLRTLSADLSRPI